MRQFATIRFPLSVPVLAAVMLSFAPGARAETPMCDEIIDDPSLTTCTCICEAGSQFSACFNADTDTEVPTPNQCPDMLQGRRVITAGDAVTIAAPRFSGSTNTIPITLLYGTENDPNNPGLGVVDGTPVARYSPNVGCRMDGGVPFPQQTRLARLFDLPYEMMVTLRPSTDRDKVTQVSCSTTNSGTTNNMVFVIDSPNEGAPALPQFDFKANASWAYLAIDDFDFDGFDDILFINVRSISLWSAVDTAAPTQGIVPKSSAETLFPGLRRAPINEPTTGDFNGDGLIDVAWIGGGFDFHPASGTLSIFFATVCPDDVPGTICDGAEPFEIILDPAAKLFPNVSGATSTIVLDNATLTANACSTVNSSAQISEETGSRRAGAIALGNFEDNGPNVRGAPSDELVVIYVSGTNGTSSDLCSTDVQYWSYSPPEASAPVWARQRGETLRNLFPEVNQHVRGTIIPPTIAVYAQAAYLDWYGPVEQAVLGVTGFGGVSFLNAWFPITARVTGTGDVARISACAAAVTTSTQSRPYAWGVAAGRFSTSTTVDPNNPTACGDFADAAPGDCPFNPQIAMLIARDQKNGGGEGGPQMRLWSVRASDPFGSGPKCANDQSVQGFLPIWDATTNISGYHSVPVSMLRAGSQLHTGDGLGRSVRVGPPEITRVNLHTQPTMVVGAPPSHVDYLAINSEDSQAPTIVNMSLAPTRFFSEMRFETESAETAGRRETTSYSHAARQGFSATKAWSAGPGVSVSVQAAFQQQWQNNTASEFGAYATQGIAQTNSAGADDHVWYASRSFNIFHYPVIGETTCPAEISCDDSDPNDIVCGALEPVSPVDLTCSEATNGESCVCVSEDAGAGLCPAPPTDADQASCQADGSDLCCAVLPQQGYLMLSGPELVEATNAPGAGLEFYQPRHEVGQLLSYPANAALLQARTEGFQRLGEKTPFNTQVDSESTEIRWTCGGQLATSVGSAFTHSYDASLSVTVGTPSIIRDFVGGAEVSVDVGYSGSFANATLNNATLAQTASQAVAISLDGADFLDPPEYGYQLAGSIFGLSAPPTVLDRRNDLEVCPPEAGPNCSAAQQIPADCITAGPLTVAYAANPFATSTGQTWWKTSGYLDRIDLSFNNPRRRRPVAAANVPDPNLYCRAGGSDCFTMRQPPAGASAAEVWGAGYYDMKGLFVTVGGTQGPQRTTAVTDDAVFLQARVYNYSLAAMDPGTQVFARFYRQQVETRDISGEPVVVEYVGTAEPIGPGGVGDPTPVPAINPFDGSATVNPFNTSTNPAFDNISSATTSFVVDEVDANTYWVFWAVVWAENPGLVSASNPYGIVPELSGHGLGAGFDPFAVYDFITDVPLELVAAAGEPQPQTFTNNVGMLKRTFYLADPADALADALADADAAHLTVERLQVVPATATLDEEVTVTAELVSQGGATPGATVFFYDRRPGESVRRGPGDPAFDAQTVPYIRADVGHFLEIPYQPNSCGTHTIVVEASSEPGIIATSSVALDVGIDTDSALRFLISEVRNLRLVNVKPVDRYIKRTLIWKLRVAKWALDAGRTKRGVYWLQAFNRQVTALAHAGRINAKKADFLVGQSDEIIGCVWSI